MIKEYYTMQEVADKYKVSKQAVHKWIKEGTDPTGEDIAEFHLLPPGSDSGVVFNRYQNINNNTFLFAGEAESEAINNDPNLSNILINQGGAFNSLV